MIMMIKTTWSWSCMYVMCCVVLCLNTESTNKTVKEQEASENERVIVIVIVIVCLRTYYNLYMYAPITLFI